LTVKAPSNEKIVAEIVAEEKEEEKNPHQIEFRKTLK